MIDCILFDLDGVLVDAADWHYEALNRALRSVCETEISIEEHLGEFNGLSTKQKLELLIARKRVHHSSVGDVQAEKQLRTIEVIEKMCKPTDRNEILGKLTQYKIGCVTNCITKTAQMMIEYFSNSERSTIFNLRHCLGNRADSEILKCVSPRAKCTSTPLSPPAISTEDAVGSWCMEEISVLFAIEFITCKPPVNYWQVV